MPRWSDDSATTLALVSCGTARTWLVHLSARTPSYVLPRWSFEITARAPSHVLPCWSFEMHHAHRPKSNLVCSLYNRAQLRPQVCALVLACSESCARRMEDRLDAPNMHVPRLVTRRPLPAHTRLTSCALTVTVAQHSLPHKSTLSVR